MWANQIFAAKRLTVLISSDLEPVFFGKSITGSGTTDETLRFYPVFLPRHPDRGLWQDLKQLQSNGQEANTVSK